MRAERFKEYLNRPSPDDLPAAETVKLKWLSIRNASRSLKNEKTICPDSRELD